MGNVAFQLEKTSGSSIAAGETVIFDAVVIANGDLSYNSSTGTLTFNTMGRYILNWWIAMQASTSRVGTVFAIEGENISPSAQMTGNSPLAAGETVGFSIIETITAPATVRLVNKSDSTIWYSANVPVKASFMVASYTDLENLDDGNATGSLIGIGAKTGYTMGDYAIALNFGTEASGMYAFAAGINSTASGASSHAEGNTTLASGDSSHAEGIGTSATSTASHAEGVGSVASGACAHAEGISTVASGLQSHAEGSISRAEGDSTHAEGDGTLASSRAAHAEGSNTQASGEISHAEGQNTVAAGIAAHAEGNACQATGNYSHAEGSGTSAVNNASHAEGDGTEASGFMAHAEGFQTLASEWASHAEGNNTQALANSSHAEGFYTVASGSYSHAEGEFTSTNLHQGAHIMGRYGDAEMDHSWFLANGTDENNRGLAAKIQTDGNAYIDIAWNAGGADYAEMFETIDGKPIEPGYFVTLNASRKIRVMQGGVDDYVLGISSAVPSILGNAGELRWKGKYKTDEWGRIEYSTVTISAEVNQSGEILVPEHVEKRPILNPEWDPAVEYIPRRKRPEWVAVGLLGQILVRDDGTCVIGGYCVPGKDGVATSAKSGYRVLERRKENQILVLFR
ncbi:MAG: peptidase G2 autoproteolytic cleavage domain-containing protein [Sporomusaceae bacterium]|nr:peptidase G2 autoproteolytic cleavage domain-containing protein [Sporomusaceae bacterium]